MFFAGLFCVCWCFVVLFFVCFRFLLGCGFLFLGVFYLLDIGPVWLVLDFGDYVVVGFLGILLV